MTIQMTQLRLNSNPKFANLTQLRLDSKPKFTNLTQLWLISFESELSQVWLTIHHILPNLGKNLLTGEGGGGAVECSCGIWSFSVKLQIIARSWRFLFEKSVTQLWLKQYPVDSTLTQMTISVIRLWLDSHPWFSRPTRLWFDSFESESSQNWLTTHESSTTLVTMHVSTCKPRIYILGTTELIAVKFVTWAETNMICSLDKAMKASVHVRTCTPHLFFEVLAWIGWFKVDDWGISRVNFYSCICFSTVVRDMMIIIVMI